MITGNAPSYSTRTLYTPDAYARYKGETTLFAAKSNAQFGYDGTPSSEYASDVSKWIQDSRRDDNVYGTIDIPDRGTITIYNSGVMDLDGFPSSESIGIDWKHLDTAEGRTDAILDNYPGSTFSIADTAITPETQKDRFATFLGNLIGNDALVEKYLGNASGNGPASVYETEATSDVDPSSMIAANRPGNEWGKIEIPGVGTVTIWNGGVVQAPESVQIDWEHNDTAEGRAAAIMQKYGGELTMANSAIRSELTEGQTKYLDSLKGMMGDDELFRTYLETSVGQSIQDILDKTADLQ